MHVCLETSFRYIGRGGVTRYIDELISALPRAEPSIQISEIACAIPNFDFKQPRRAAVTTYREYFWTPFLAPRELRQLNPDVFHMTCFSDIPHPKNIPSVVTIYDLSQMRFPSNYRPYTRFKWKYLYRKMREADAVIAISEFTKREAIELLDIPEEKIHAIALAPTPQTQTVPLTPLISNRLPENFFLFVGSLSPNKNLALLVSTYALAKMRGIRLPPLIVVGIRIDGVTREMEAPDDWVFIERVSDADLSGLYKRACALLYPSLYEGFGLPILEAMVAGCPAVCSPVASLPQAGGDAACYADLNPESYLQTLVRLVEDDEYRRERIQIGKSHAAQFTWEKTARETISVYNRIIRK